MALTFKERLEKLNDKQRLAVETTEGPVLVVAGPGSGKTELLSLRTGNILKQGQVSPHNILCLTFTDNGALNMRERLSALIGQDAYRVSIFTFHAFCNHIIARYPEYFWSATNFSQVNNVTRAEILESLFKSLPHGHPLASRNPEKGFVYLKNVVERIKHIKSFGLTADEYIEAISMFPKEYGAIHKILAEWPERLSTKKLESVEDILSKLDTLNGEMGIYLAKTLRQALIATEALGKTEPLAVWKSKYTVKGDNGLILKDAHNQEKIDAVADMYKRYSEEMYRRALYDFDDMIIEVVHALKTETILRNELEEQYQYIMVDEFQDTNEAQMSLVRAISSHPVHEGHPNVCVVGDDDQAIYKFQGADISHIINFRDNLYKDVKTIVLDKNYRSTKPILDLARTIIMQGGERLENKYANITKILSSESINLPKGSINISTYTSDVAEYAHVAREVRKILDSGTEPNDVAILSREHRELRALLPYLDRENIPYEYTKRANVFDEPHVKILIDMCAYISSIMQHEATAEHVLPRLLAHPCFQINRLSLFTLAVEAKEGRKSWTEILTTSDVPRIKELGILFAELAIEGETTPLEHILEKFMGRSGFKEFYFSRELIKKSPTTYVAFLASLKTFIESLREWREGEILFVSDVAPFVEMHIDHGIALISSSPFMKNENSVQLMSAHTSKGLEFGTVFIISASDTIWTKSPRTNIAPIPAPLVPRMQPVGDNEDDFIRLLYVAMTRAKHTLYISNHDTLVRYLVSENKSLEGPPFQESDEVPIEAHENALALHKEPFKEEEWALLKRLIKDYRMPVTHLTNFLNVKMGGPMLFLEQNLLRFPQPKNPSGVYGTAMHSAVEEIAMYPKYNGGEQAPFTRIIDIFQKEINRGRLPCAEQAKQSSRGVKALTRFYEITAGSFLPDDQVEVDMKNEGVMLGKAHLTGKLDLLRTYNGTYEVYDFKTGKISQSWNEAKSDEDKIKLHNYRLQLITYKLLLENSIHFKNKPITKSALWFIEGDPLVELVLDASDAEIDRVKKLIEAVYKKIINLDFPDISKYKDTYKALLQFEDDLIEGKI